MWWTKYKMNKFIDSLTYEQQKSMFASLLRLNDRQISRNEARIKAMGIDIDYVRKELPIMLQQAYTTGPED